MGDFKMTFAITIIDNRNSKSIVHSVSFYLNENESIEAGILAETKDDFRNENAGILAGLQTKSVADLLNGNDGSWEDLLKQSVDVTIKNMFRELIQMEKISNIPDILIETGDFSLEWMENDQMVEIPAGVLAGTTLNTNEDPNGLLQSGNFTFRRMENDRLVPVSGGAGASFGDLIDCFKSNHLGHNVMFVASLLVLE